MLRVDDKMAHDAINTCPALDLPKENDIFTLQERAAAFKRKNTHGLFDYLIVDGICIKI